MKLLVKLSICIAIFFLFNINLHCQGEYSQWYFQNYAGIDFRNDTVKAISGAMDGNWWPDCGTICDKYGNLLFYTDGYAVWNREHKIMPNGTGLTKGAVLILPWPKRENFYYIFTGWERYYRYDSSRYEGGFNYSVVDMSLDGGLGDITYQKNVSVYDSVAPTITAFRHSNGTDYWVVLHSIGQKRYFQSYLINYLGFNKIPAESESNDLITSEKWDDFWNYQCYDGLKPSMDGKKIAICYPNINKFRIYDYDNSTGLVSSPQTFTMLPMNSDTSFGDNCPISLEFSPDGSKIYVSSISIWRKYGKITDSTAGLLTQFNLKAGNEDEIMKSGVVLDSTFFYYFNVIDNERQYTALQLGPDKKIYCARRGDKIGVINEPNNLGKACQFDSKSLQLQPGTNSIGVLPFCMPGLLNKLMSVVSNSPLCEGDTLKLLANISPSLSHAKFEWSGPNGFTSDIKEPNIPNVTPNLAGIYRLTVTTKDDSFSDSIKVTIYPIPKPEITSDKPLQICEDDSVTLTVTPVNNDYTCKWNNGSTLQSITVNSPGMYIASIQNGYGCIRSDTAIVKVVPKFQVKIFGETEICEGDSIILTAEPSGIEYNYLWSTKYTTSSININQPGKYWVLAQYEGGGCQSSDSIEVRMIPKPHIKIHQEAGKSLCKGDSIKLLVETTGVISNILWSTGETSQSIMIKDAGNYNVTVTGINGCKSIDSINIEFGTTDLNLSSMDNINFGEVCAGDSVEKEFILTNSRIEDVLIQSINCNTYKNIFHIDTKPPLPCLLKSNENISINFKFLPDDNINYYDSLILKIIEPCPYEYSTSISGTGKAGILVWLSDLKAKAGDTNFCIPLKAKFNCNCNNNLNLSFNAEIRFDATAFLPITSEQGFVENGDRVLNINGNATISQNETILSLLCGTVLLGNNDSNPIKITNFTWQSNVICNGTKDGSILLTEVCAQSNRKIKLIQPLDIQLFPNPAGSNITISAKIHQLSDFHIAIYNSIGDKKFENYEIAGAGKYLKEINIESLASGIYFVNISINGENWCWSVVKE